MPEGEAPSPGLFDDGGRRGALTLYVGTFIDFISFRRQGETLSISFPIFSLGTRKEGTDIRANRAGALQGEKAAGRASLPSQHSL